MHTTIDYSKSPAKNFDAVEDIKDYLGKAKYEEVIDAGIGQFKNTRQFAFFCMIAGIEGFPVIAWYDHFHGEGAWAKAEGIAEGEAND